LVIDDAGRARSSWPYLPRGKPVRLRRVADFRLLTYFARQSLMWFVLDRSGCGVVAQALSLVAVLALAGPAVAQKASDRATESKYQELIRRALEEYSAGNWTEARVFFEDAHAISPNARTLRGLGMTSYEARSYVEAISFLEQALASQVRPLTPPIAQEARRVLEQARRFVSPVDIVLEPASAELRIDGKIIGKAERQAVVLDPGEHEFAATAAGFASGRRVLVAEGGRRLNLHLILQSEQASQSAPRASAATEPLATPAQSEVAPPRAAASDRQVVLGAVLGIVGAGGIAAGWVFYALRQHVRTQLPPTVADAPLVSLADVDRFHNHGYRSLVAAGLGASLLAVSDLFWLPDEVGVPTWAWAVGALGAATGLVALGVGVLGTHCDIADPRLTCQSFSADSTFGPLLALHALPLLAVPLAYAVRIALRPAAVEVSLQWSGASALGPGLSVAGRF
jgi:hypothetical protein